MIFSSIETEQDIERLKKRIVKDVVLSARLHELRTAMNYTKGGESRRTGDDTHTTMPTKAEMLALYRSMVEEGTQIPNPKAEMSLRKIKTKSNSGVAVVSLLTKPFPCPGRCTYCPTEERMPKSYLSKEPAAARALQNDFDPYKQVTSRLQALQMNGHPTDKIEMIVIGGTWSFYHPVYQEEFLIGCYRAANDFSTDNDSRTEIYKDRLEYLQELQTRNEQAKSRIIGLSIETRPDYITEFEVVRLRRLGVTKVEVGVQHLDDAVLKATKRDMRVDRVKRATEMLRNAGFKMVYHMMPNLPTSTPERDIAMFGELFSGKDYQPDMLKIYPCMVLENSELYETWKSGGYQPYDDETLKDILAGALAFVPPYVRVIRVIRDIPATYIHGGSHISNLREEVEKRMRAKGTPPRDIRTREVREMEVLPDEFSLVTREYRTESGEEIFLSFEHVEKDKIASFIRLRLPDVRKHPYLTELEDAALVRELHTYGKHMRVHEPGSQSQHVGFGTRLLKEAESIAKAKGYKKIAIISGIGVRDYYRKRGYTLEGTYMIKQLV